MCAKYRVVYLIRQRFRVANGKTSLKPLLLPNSQFRWQLHETEPTDIMKQTGHISDLRVDAHQQCQRVGSYSGNR